MAAGFLYAREMKLQVLAFVLSAGLCLVSPRRESGADYFGTSQEAEVDIRVKLDKILQTVSERFLSVTLDSSLIMNHWKIFDFQSQKIQALARGLSPCYLRVGGSMSDYLIFNMTEENGTETLLWQSPSFNQKQQKPKRFSMTISDWDNLNKFVETVGWDLIFGLNLLVRDKAGTWDAANAMELLRYTEHKGYKLAGLELGNEPDVYRNFLPKVPDPAVFGKDFVYLRYLMGLFPFLKEAKLLGPDVTNLSVEINPYKNFFIKFLKAAGHVLDAVTIHQYFKDGKHGKEEDFVNPKLMDVFRSELSVGSELIAHLTPGLHLWIGETSAMWDGGCAGLSNSYLDGFMWLNKLGVGASFGVQVMMRQQFYSGNYGLIDFRTSDPNPDYWLSLLYKMLVGTRVLRVSLSDLSGKVRAYGHCSNQKRSSYPSGALTLYALNMLNVSVVFNFPQFNNQEIHIYSLQPVNNKLSSRFVTLNGKVLEMVNDELPALTPHIQKSQPVIFPAKTFGFIVFPRANIAVCL